MGRGTSRGVVRCRGDGTRHLGKPVGEEVAHFEPPGQRETEADRYSLQTVNEPDALATALVKTAEYRYPRPSALEEALFYTHPSVEKRALMAMEWKAAHPDSPSQP